MISNDDVIALTKRVVCPTPPTGEEYTWAVSEPLKLITSKSEEVAEGIPLPHNHLMLLTHPNLSTEFVLHVVREGVDICYHGKIHCYNTMVTDYREGDIVVGFESPGSLYGSGVSPIPPGGGLLFT